MDRNLVMLITSLHHQTICEDIEWKFTSEYKTLQHEEVDFVVFLKELDPPDDGETIDSVFHNMIFFDRATLIHHDVLQDDSLEDFLAMQPFFTSMYIKGISVLQKKYHYFSSSESDSESDKDLPF